MYQWKASACTRWPEKRGRMVIFLIQLVALCIQIINSALSISYLSLQSSVQVTLTYEFVIKLISLSLQSSNQVTLTYEFVIKLISKMPYCCVQFDPIPDPF